MLSSKYAAYIRRKNMQSNTAGGGKALSTRHSRIAVFISIALGASVAVSGAEAQELTHRFINPSFGGNPFNSEHLLGIANIHRPEQPEAQTPIPTEEELLARQIQSRFNAQLQSQIIERIQSAQPGQSGSFELGNQRISFTRTLTETRITFLNTTTGESRLVVVPVNSSGAAIGASAGGASSPERALGALGTTPGAPLSGGLSTALLGSPLRASDK
jgi:curli production assembly/transport component CsgF